MYEIYDWYADSITPDQLEMSVRTPLRHVGMGQMMALDRDEIKRLAEKQYPEYGISGKVNYIIEKGVKHMGLSGHKANHHDLTVELGYLSDMGVTNSRYLRLQSRILRQSFLRFQAVVQLRHVALQKIRSDQQAGISQEYNPQDNLLPEAIQLGLATFQCSMRMVREFLRF